MDLTCLQLTFVLYLQAPSSQKDYVNCGVGFGLENVGKVALIWRDLLLNTDDALCISEMPEDTPG